MHNCVCTLRPPPPPAHMDGESLEKIWAYLAPPNPATKEMQAGSRRMRLDEPSRKKYFTRTAMIGYRAAHRELDVFRNMPVMRGATLPKDKLDELFIGVMRIVDQDSWRYRGRDKCTCGRIALFACSDCNVPDLCNTCMVQAHQGSPFHSIREWSERVSHYIPATLREMGLRVGFGHGGGTCPRPRAERLEAVTVTGIKTVNRIAGGPLGSNFVSVMTVEMLNVLVGHAEEDTGDAVEPDGSDSGSGEESNSDKESDAGTESSTSE
ncbi:hypothetical protein B0H14DRAFT_3452107 [Mycena olivaceomarginata]|nr:hypothetical protein B0H14DRAFT_3452107 [Mycena olivaceomarginata]